MREYIVKSGDTLGKIAKAFYGDAGQYILIAEANQIEDVNKIKVGQKLKIPELPVVTPSSGEYTDLTKEQLKQIMPYASQKNRERYLMPLNKVMKKYEINTPLRKTHFLAQLAHESGSLRYSEEIASGEAYEGRADLGNTQPGDGKRFKGRGLIQLTGRANYSEYSKYIKIDLIENPEKLTEDADLAVDVAGWYWMKKKLNDLAENDDVRGITFRINGGYNGLDDRESHLKKAKAVLGGKP